MKILRKLFNPFKMNPKEYEASITALNLFFGAVIGVSLGNINETSTVQYIEILIITASAVMSILFVAYSEKKLTNVVTSISILCLLWLVDGQVSVENSLPPKVLPTLGVWLGLVIFTELWRKIQYSD